MPAKCVVKNVEFINNTTGEVISFKGSKGSGCTKKRDQPIKIRKAMTAHLGKQKKAFRAATKECKGTKGPGKFRDCMSSQIGIRTAGPASKAARTAKPKSRGKKAK